MTTPLIGLTMISLFMQGSEVLPSTATAISAAPSQEIVHHGADFAIQSIESSAAAQSEDNSRTLKLGARVFLPVISRSAAASQEAGHALR